MEGRKRDHAVGRAGQAVLSAAANGETEIDLTWAAPADNGADITRYETPGIRRRHFRLERTGRPDFRLGHLVHPQKSFARDEEALPDTGA